MAPQPTRLPRDQHIISRSNISDNALKVLYRLRDGGFDAYLVGGSVRDLLLGLHPKDFDIATDAKPEEIRKLFRNCRLIGRRFRLAHIFFVDEIIEVATFRGQQISDDENKSQRSASGIILRDNVYGTIEEDALRRDFTINAFYYSIDGFHILDFADGMQDLLNKQIRLMGDPSQRYREDPVRMLRAVRFAAKLNMTIEPNTADPIIILAPLLDEISPSRLFDETLKLFHNGHAVTTLTLLHEHQLFARLFPQTVNFLQDKHFKPLLQAALSSTDERIQAEKPVNPAFLFATLLWPCYLATQQTLIEDGISPALARDQAIEQVIRQQARITTIPRRHNCVIKEIWRLQPRLERRTPKQILKLLAHRRFRAAYDFLLNRAQADQTLATVAHWWTEIQQAKGLDNKQAFIKTLKSPPKRHLRKKK